jgi:hypothetical protein
MHPLRGLGRHEPLVPAQSPAPASGVSGAVALTLLAVAGCSSGSSSPAPAAASASSSAAASSAAKVPLVVYSAQGYDSAMTKAFTTATGIPVQLGDNSTGPLLTQIEASKDNPNWGLLWELRVKVVAHAGDGTVEVTAAGGGTFPRLRPGGGTAAGERHLTGRVADVAFRGRGYELAIDLPGHGRLTGVFARHRAVRGEEVGLRPEPDGCHLFAAAAAGTPDTSVRADTAGSGADPAATTPENGSLEEKAAITG